MRFLVSTLSIVAVALIAVIALLRGADGPVKAPQQEAVPVTIADVQSATGAEVIEATGTLVLKRETALSFKVAGVITSLGVRAGDTVDVSGPIGFDPEPMPLVEGIGAQMQRVFRNLAAIAQAATSARACSPMHWPTPGGRGWDCSCRREPNWALRSPR